MKKIFYITLLLIIVLIPVSSFASGSISAFQMDAAKIISKPAEKYIDTKNKELSKKCGADIIIATVKTTGELSMGEYANELRDNLHLDSRGSSNSVLVVMCTEKKDYTIVVSEGITGSFTMQIAEQCLAEYAEEDFAKKQYTAAAIKTYNGIAKWYNDNYKNVSLELSNDLSKYEDIINTEQQKKNQRKINHTIIVTVLVLAILIIFLYFKRKYRLIKARKKRQERRTRYMQRIRNR